MSAIISTNPPLQKYTRTWTPELSAHVADSPGSAMQTLCNHRPNLHLVDSDEVWNSCDVRLGYWQNDDFPMM